MANFQVLDAFGSVITIQSSTFSSAERQIVGASIMGVVPITGTITTSNTSVTAFMGGNWSTSIVGAPIFAEDTASADADKGLFVLAIRNDNVASLVSADKDYTGIATDSAGRVLTKPFAPSESRIQGIGSAVGAGSANSVLLVAAAGAGLKNKVTDFFLSNTSATNTVVNFSDGNASVLGTVIVPNGGGFSAPGIATPIETAANSALNFYTTTAASVVYATVYGHKAP